MSNCMMSTMPETVSVLTLRRTMSVIVSSTPMTNVAVLTNETIRKNRSLIISNAIASPATEARRQVGLAPLCGESYSYFFSATTIAS
jgi:hypothetical protein